jgi:hypothetical protein
LRRATPARWVIIIPVAANSLRDPQFPWVQIFLKMFPLSHATAAGRDTFLQAAANFLRDPQSPRVSFSGSPRHPAPRCPPLCRFFNAPEDFTAAHSMVAFCYSATDCIISGFGSVFSGLASVASWQAVLYFRPPFMSAIQISIFS